MTGIEEFNSLDADGARESLMACCAVRSWAEGVAAARPYADPDALVSRAMTVFDELPGTDIRQAVAAHPAIGARVAGRDRESVWSRGEQRGAESADAGTAAAQAEANAAYERRFGHVFLIRATGRSAAELLAEARRRLHNTPDDEAIEVRRELRDIVALRLRKLVNP